MGGSDTSLPGDLDALAEAIEPAVRALHWALLSIDHQPTELEAHAITPDDRRVAVFARPGGEGRIAVTVRVGRLGHPDLEEQLFDELRRALDE